MKRTTLFGIVCACALTSILWFRGLAGGCHDSKLDDIAFLTQRIGTNSYADVLAACRTLIPQEGREIPLQLEKLKKEDVAIIIYPSYQGFNDLIPGVVRGLQVKFVTVNRDFVLMPLDLSNRRLALVAFRDGAQEFGSAELLPGLWCWNGTGAAPRTYSTGATWGHPRE